MKTTILKKIILVSFTLIPLNSVALDTTHTHPLVTKKISELIKDSDTAGSYFELYEIIPNVTPEKYLYWGTDDDPVGLTDPDAIDDPTGYLLDLDATPYANYNNVMDGVVQEDLPATKVLNHFYHAESEDGLSLNGGVLSIGPWHNSANTAMNYFNQSIMWMSGYDSVEEVDPLGLGFNSSAKKYAFFTFGQALHHVEDMGSPAHIHNDAHLVVEEDEKDDYEGWYLPFLKLSDGANLDSFFKSYATAVEAKNAIKPVSNPWNEIWNNSNGVSMVKYFYDKTTYRETLEFPLDIPNPLQPLEFTKPVPPSDPYQELYGMFPCINDFSGEKDYTVPNCLYWDEEDLYTQSHWRINAVGQYQHQYVNGSDNDWWPVDVEQDHSAISTSNPRNFNGVSARYYIEQLSKGNTDGTFGLGRDINGIPVIPNNMRSDFNLPWNSNSIVNDKELRYIYAENLLPPVVEYGAGFSQYWYDVANTPPYLNAINVTQGVDNGGNPKFVYSANWVDEVVHVHDVITDVERCYLLDTGCDTLTAIVSYVESRTLDLNYSKVSHIANNSDLTIEFIFSEPMQKISLLRIGKFNDTGICVEPDSSCLELIDPGISSDDKTWVVTLTPTQLSGMNGKLQLTIKAIDKNNHTEGTDIPGGGSPSNAGGELDGAPDTPARRNITFAQSSIGAGAPVNYYPWYKKDGVDDTADDIAYSYDPENGDTNHWLVFDTSPPSTTINIDLTL